MDAPTTTSASRTPVSADRVAAPDRGRWRQVARSANLLDAAGAVAPTVFATMSALAASTGAINLGQGFPDTDGPASLLEAAAAAIRGGVQPVPARARRARAAPADRRAPAPASTASSSTRTPRCWSRRGRPRRSPPRCSALLRARRRGESRSSRTTTPTRPCIALAGAVRRTVPLRLPDVPARPRRTRAAVTPRTRLILLNTPAQPDRHGVHRAELDRDRGRSRSSTTCWSSPTRCTSTWSSTGRARADRDAARACASGR